MNAVESGRDEMKILKWMAGAFATYSRVPMPKLDQDREDVQKSLMFFPLVGLFAGGAVYLINCLPRLSGLPAAVRIILTILLPILITGGFHIDGLMDTMDAMNSYASRENKLEILKDPHIGAFAVIGLLKWMLIDAAGVTAILLNEKTDRKVIGVFCLTFVLSRVSSALTSLLFKKARTDGMLFEETGGKQTGVIICLTLTGILTAFFMLILNTPLAVSVLAALILFTIRYRKKTASEFGGVTGDTAGYFVTAFEALAALVMGAAQYLI